MRAVLEVDALLLRCFGDNVHRVLRCAQHVGGVSPWRERGRRYAPSPRARRRAAAAGAARRSPGTRAASPSPARP